MNNFTLQSNDLKGQITKAQVLNDPGKGCDGESVSPHLSWTDAPDGTLSFVITLHDPNAPTPSGWWHWCVFDIPGDVREIRSGEQGFRQTKNDSGTRGFMGACPPKGDRHHAYIFTVYALDSESLGLDEEASPAKVSFMLNNHLLAKTSLISYYKQ